MGQECWHCIKSLQADKIFSKGIEQSLGKLGEQAWFNVPPWPVWRWCTHPGQNETFAGTMQKLYAAKGGNAKPGKAAEKLLLKRMSETGPLSISKASSGSRAVRFLCGASLAFSAALL